MVCENKFLGKFEKPIDKLKNVFIEEEEVESEPEEKPKKQEKLEEEKIEPIKEDIVSDRDLIDTNQNFKFPIIFEEEDFKEEKKKSRSINVLERENTKYETEIKRDIKSQKKTFKPSPVISPVYGVLDKNYTKDEISSKNGLLSDYSDKLDIDSVINKAYGNTTTREEKNKEKNTDEIINLFSEENTEEIGYELDEIDAKATDDKIKSIDDLLKDSNEDFYSLVDSMYKDDEGDEE